MPGGGTKADITRAERPAARLLDLTRLVSRAGRGLTGVDRVELAYLSELLRRDDPVYGLVRCFWGHAVLDRAGMAALRDRVTGAVPWGAAPPLMRLARRLDADQRRGQADAYRLARARAPRRGLGEVLRRILPPGTTYLNTGHTNLTARICTALRRVPRLRIAVLVHDTIPLDHPDWQRPESVPRFRAFLDLVQRQADLVIANSRTTAAGITRHFNPAVPQPPIVPALLGVTAAAPEPLPDWLANALRDGHPYFTVIGTIEPRKNHAHLLDTWEEMADKLPPGQVPRLLICGARGWRNTALLDRLQAHPLAGHAVLECPGLSDGQIVTLHRHATAQLFPSLAEGFGLPPAEAALAGVPVLCHDLPALREVLGEFPVYLPRNDIYAWAKQIMNMTRDHVAGTGPGPVGQSRALPGWGDHFDTVLAVI
ncbi:glycosyltransferase family 4 protein [Pseudooceanicola aestuarii]|uniref:glycosyltransferase family 4 protein n=1 Tax=Pseudooceanicola aestuarii TaxID=2697319 RepID=UPI0013D82EE4|nr:glycosyltransferase family 1 protein [Pseudooceanicola aestuarii]